MEQVSKDFRDRVYALVATIPRGKVMTYGQLAALAGSPYAARVVGGIAHWGDQDLPWQRVVKKSGSLAEGYPGGLSGHKQVLEAEGVEVSDDYRVDVKELLWWPPNPSQNSLL
jgi:methylated-DNA-protein-cysteine methyltransferase-like protein